MRKILLLSLLIAGIIVLAHAESSPPLKQPGQPSPTSQVWPGAIGSFQYNWQGTKSIYVFNNSGGSLAAGDLLVWDNTITAVVDTYDASGAGSGTYDTCTIADSILHFTWHEIYTYFSNPTNDSIVIVGLDSANAAQTDTIVKASTAGNVYSTLYWRKVNLAFVLNSAANIGVNFVPYSSVTTTTTTGDPNVAGVCAGTYAADSLTKIHIEGLTTVKLLGATTEVNPGDPLVTGATAKYGLPSTDMSPCFGYALGSGNTNTTYQCHILPVPQLKQKHGTDTFTGTKTADTVLVAGLLSGDHIIVTPIGSAAWTTAITGQVLGAGSLVVYVAEADTATARADGYNWLVLD